MRHRSGPVCGHRAGYFRRGLDRFEAQIQFETCEFKANPYICSLRFQLGPAPSLNVVATMCLRGCRRWHVQVKILVLMLAGDALKLVTTRGFGADAGKTLRQTMVFDDPLGSAARGGPVQITLV